MRGATEVVNQFGGNCLSCHAQAEKKWDMICEQTHGCAPIPITPIMAKAIQNTDPRCPKVDLPPEQQAAMKQLMAFRAAAHALGQLIGRTDAVLWDADRAEPALVTPGTRVRFIWPAASSA